MKVCDFLRVLFSLVALFVSSAHAENSKAVFESVKKGDTEAIVQYLAQSGDVNVRNSSESTLIMIAARHRRYDLVSLLKDSGADIGLVNRDGNGLLYYYIEGFQLQNNLPVITEMEVKPVLGEMKKLPYIANRDGNTSLHEAVQSSSMPASVVALLISMHKDMNVVNKRGDSAMHKAALVHIPALVKAGAKIDLKNSYGETPLKKAIENGDVEKIRYLVEHGADLKQVIDHDGNTAIMMTTKLELIEWFLDHGVDASIRNRKHRTALQVFLDRNYYREEDKDLFIRVLERLARANPDLDYQYDHTQAPAVLEAAKNGNMAAIRYLLDRGASTKVTSTHHTVLTALIGTNSGIKHILDDVRFLAASGADINAIDSGGNTLLQLSIQNGYSEQNGIAEWLISQGVNINHRNEQGVSPLMSAVDKRNLKIVRLLVKKGADVNLRDNSGISAILRPCCGDESFPIIRTLIEHGASASDYSNSNRSLQLSGFSEEQVRYLLNHGYNPNIFESKVTPGGALDRYHDEPFVKLLKSHGALHDIDILKLEEKAFRSVEHGDMKLLKNALSAGYYVNNMPYEKYYSGAPSFDITGKGTLLSAAIFYRQPEMVRFLLEQGANPSRAMPAAMESGNLEILKLLVEKGADVNYHFSINGGSISRWPLHYAIEHKQNHIARYLVEKGAWIDKAPNVESVIDSPLYAAIIAGDKTMAELLIARGATVQDNKLLVKAYEIGEFEIANLLRNKGLIIPEAFYTVTGKKQTEEEYAFASNNPRAPGPKIEKAVQNAILFLDLARLKQFVAEGYVFRLSSEKQYDWSGDWHNLGNAIHQAAAAHATDMLHYIDEQSGKKLKLTPAMLAASDGDLEALKQTVTKENLEEKNTFGTTAFYFAILAHCESCVLYLLEQGADTHVGPYYMGSRIHDNSQPLVLAARWSLPVVKAIMARDLNHKMFNPDIYENAMMVAIKSNRMDIAMELKNGGVVFNERSGLKYQSVLIDAIRDNNIERIKQMLEIGADPNKVTATAYGGYTALAMAITFNRTAIADLLLEHALDSDKPSPALQVAAESMLYAHRNDRLNKLFSHPEVLNLDKLFSTAVNSRNAVGLKLVLKLADKQDYVLKDFDKTKTDLQKLAEQLKDVNFIQTQMDYDRIKNILAVMK